MNSESVSKKQLVANRQNAKKGGVKTSEGKAVSAMNAEKHGILSVRLRDTEESLFLRIINQLREELSPSTVMQKVLVERIATHILQLERVSFARDEFLKKCENPGKVVDHAFDCFNDFVEVVTEAYKPEISSGTVERLLLIYHRYEVSLENRLYRAIREFNNLNST